MTSEQFLQQFGHFVDAPNGIKKLRELILQLAIQGKLVPHDPQDEPASMLLEKAGAEKSLLIKEKKIKKAKEAQDLAPPEVPFETPSSWEMCRFVDVAYIVRGVTFPASAKNHSPGPGLVACLRSGNIQNQVVWDDLLYIPETHVKNQGQYIEDKDILISMANSYELVGKVALVTEQPMPAVIGGFLGVIRCIGPDPDYISAYLRSPWVQRKFRESSSQTTNIANISIGQTNQLPIPVPPLAEQHRIVAKVDELMALCDQLEAERNAREETHQRLIRAVHHPLTVAGDAAGTQTAWNRIRDNFADLYTTLESAQALRQTILQLAVQGELVPQDTNEEPASALLQRISDEKQELVKARIIKQPKSLPPVSSSEMMFQNPANWAVTRLSDFATEIATGPFGSMVHKSDYVDGGAPLINPSHMINGAIVPDPSITLSEEKAQELASYKLYPDDIVMARRGEMGRCALVPKGSDGWLCGTGSFVLRFHKDVVRQFILLLFSSAAVKTYLGGNSVGTTMTNLNHGILNKMPVAVPPMAEQRRIVAKVDELMALCDQLEAQLTAKSDTATRYAEAVVQQIAAA